MYPEKVSARSMISTSASSGFDSSTRGDAEKFDARLSLHSYHERRRGGSHEEVRMIVYRSLLSSFRGRTAEGFA
jgi:hypothetical protein